MLCRLVVKGKFERKLEFTLWRSPVKGKSHCFIDLKQTQSPARSRWRLKRLRFSKSHDYDSTSTYEEVPYGPINSCCLFSVAFICLHFLCFLLIRFLNSLISLILKLPYSDIFWNYKIRISGKENTKIEILLYKKLVLTFIQRSLNTWKLIMKSCHWTYAENVIWYIMSLTMKDNTGKYKFSMSFYQHNPSK